MCIVNQNKNKQQPQNVPFLSSSSGLEKIISETA
jgi:hypothetical protein